MGRRALNPPPTVAGGIKWGRGRLPQSLPGTGSPGGMTRRRRPAREGRLQEKYLLMAFDVLHEEEWKPHGAQSDQHKVNESVAAQVADHVLEMLRFTADDPELMLNYGTKYAPIGGRIQHEAIFFAGPIGAANASALSAATANGAFAGFQPGDVGGHHECPDQRWAEPSVVHFPLFAPAFDRRPYFREDAGALLVELDVLALGGREVEVAAACAAESERLR